MWLILKLLCGARMGLFVLAFLAMFAGFMAIRIGEIISRTDRHKVMQHNIEDYHRLNDWRLK